MNKDTIAMPKLIAINTIARAVTLATYAPQEILTSHYSEIHGYDNWAAHHFLTWEAHERHIADHDRDAAVMAFFQSHPMKQKMMSLYHTNRRDNRVAGNAIYSLYSLLSA